MAGSGGSHGGRLGFPSAGQGQTSWPRLDIQRSKQVALRPSLRGSTSRLSLVPETQIAAEGQDWLGGSPGRPPPLRAAVTRLRLLVEGRGGIET